MVQIASIRTLKGVGVLADRAVGDAGPGFLRYNLIYGFIGSGKSTLSRLLSCLQSGAVHAALPDSAAFSFQLEDGTLLSSPDKLAGLEERVCVFNTDFIERHLRWAEGKASSIFYISEEQAEAAAALRDAELDLPRKNAALVAAEESLSERTQALATLKKTQARTIAGKLHLPPKRYEAPHLADDYREMTFDASSILESGILDEQEEMAKRSDPPPAASSIELPIEEVPQIVEQAGQHATANIGDTMLAELKTHAAMVPWAERAHEYHRTHALKTCLFCGGELTKERDQALSSAFNDALSQFITDLASGEAAANRTTNQLKLSLGAAEALALMPEFRKELQAALLKLREAMPDVISTLADVQKLYSTRRGAPTSPVNAALPAAERIAQMCDRLRSATATMNALIERHNEAVKGFATHQDTVRQNIRRHFLAEGSVDYEAAQRAVTQAEVARVDAATAHAAVKDRIADLRNKVRTHGPAATAITKLVKQYLGHGELSVDAATEGYELRRHGELVKGPPSEGEKSAIALCYFLSTLEADGRSVKDLIVVIDDPISSLDTRAMNYACALIRARLRNAGQVFVLTHNQHCMNEFKKEWKALARPKDEKAQPTAMLLYLDVTMPEATPRSSSMVEMSKLLREYDSEYHFLCAKVLEFEKAGAGYSPYAYLMPHVIRRVLELFLAFKVPGSGPVKDKLDALAKLHTGLDKTRLLALERLSQVESHSDSMDDFVTHSSMTVEESRDANAALLQLMDTADEYHMKAIRKHCAAA